MVGLCASVVVDPAPATASAGPPSTAVHDRLTTAHLWDADPPPLPSTPTTPCPLPFHPLVHPFARGGDHP